MGSGSFAVLTWKPGIAIANANRKQQSAKQAEDSRKSARRFQTHLAHGYNVSGGENLKGRNQTVQNIQQDTPENQAVGFETRNAGKEIVRSADLTQGLYKRPDKFITYKRAA